MTAAPPPGVRAPGGGALRGDSSGHAPLLSDHFGAEYGWRITDTRELRTPTFTTLLGAEPSSAAWDDRLV
jgi:hypothetical protein